jgi:hypothetical protein
VWIKSRTQARHHGLFDSVRGEGVYIQSSNTDGDGTSEGGVIDFNTNGFTIANDNNINFNEAGEDEVAWCWKAGGTASTIAVDTYSAGSPSVASTVSANTTSGFSIVKYTGTNDSTNKVAHGLDQKPEVILLKKLTASTDWAVYHESAVDADTKFLYLNTTAALTTGGATRWDISEFDADTFTVGDDHSVNAASTDYIAYCFHSVEGFSKFGSYTGATNGVFVYLGFRPAFVMIKNTGSSSWWMMDSKRDTYNVMDDYLIADNTTVGTYTSLDFLSNGFRTRNTSSSFNTNGATHIYMAFAENPFKYSNAR